jgi:hypothetical protein
MRTLKLLVGAVAVALNLVAVPAARSVTPAEAREPATVQSHPGPSVWGLLRGQSGGHHGDR